MRLLLLALLAACALGRRQTLTLTNEKRAYFIVSSFGLLQGGTITISLSHVRRKTFSSFLIFDFLCLLSLRWCWWWPNAHQSFLSLPTWETSRRRASPSTAARRNRPNTTLYVQFITFPTREHAARPCSHPPRRIKTSIHA